MDLPFRLPPPPTEESEPVWMGSGFRLGSRMARIVDYGENLAGWSDDLTDLHERAAGATHPIDVASRRDAVRQLRSRLIAPRPTILEIGCSSGHLLHDMATAFPDAVIIGADVVRGPLERLAARLPGVPLLRFDIQECPLPPGAVDAVVMLNVLEHVEDDGAALRQVHRILKPGGIVVIEVPAGAHLFDDYDRALKHFRRYRVSDLARTLEQSGFRVLRRSHLGFLLYPAFALAKRRNQGTRLAPADLRRHVEQQVTSTASSGAMRAALIVEAVLGRWVRYPIGIRCLVLGQRVWSQGEHS